MRMHEYRRLMTKSCLALFACASITLIACEASNSIGPAVPFPGGDPEVALSCTAGLTLSRSAMLATWIPSDSTVELRLPLHRSTARRTRCNTALKNPLVSTFDIQKVAMDGDTMVRVQIRPRRRGFGYLRVSLNEETSIGINVFVASVAFADAAIGHRGSGGLWPENTLQAVLAGARSHLLASEMDVRLTKDTVPVLMHDVTIDRTTTGSGSVEDYTFSQLQSFDVSPSRGAMFSGIHVPALEQIIAGTVATDHHLLLDVKRDGQTILPPDQEARLVVDLVKKYDAEHRVTLQSTSRIFLAAARAASPTIGLQLFDWGFRPEYFDFSRQIHATSIMHHPDSLLLPRMGPIIDSLQAAGIMVYASTTDRATQADSLIERGIRYVLTDIPPRAFRDSKLLTAIVVTPP
jgi:glycerophosphoryl diester phosphodiesterase